MPSLAQQTAGRRDTSAVCFNPSPLPRCRSFAVVEVELMGLRNRSPESYTTPGQLTYFSSLETHVSVELGWPRNLNDRSALGGTLVVGTMSGDGGRYCVKGRYRRWLDGQFAVDLEGGPLAVSGGSGHSPFARDGAFGATTGVEFAYRDLIALSANVDAVNGDRAQSAVFLGLRAGSWAAPMFAAGLIGLLIAILKSIE
jgi:hypothetical protein